MYKAGEILLLVGGILRIVGGAFFVLMGILFATFLSTVMSGSSTRPSSTPPPTWLPGFFAGVYIVIGVLVAVGGVLGLVGWKKAKAGQPGSAFVWGLVGSLLPPVDILLLLGAIFCKVSENQQPPAYPAHPPPGGFSPAYPPPGYPPRPPQAR